MNVSPKVDLLLPGLFDRLVEWTGSYVEKPEAPELVSLLQKATHQRSDYLDYESTLWHQFHARYQANIELPAGRICSDLKGEVVCRADPVHLTAGISDLMLIEASQLNLDAEETEMLTRLVNEHVNPVGGSFECSGATGVLAFEQAPILQSTPPSRVAGNGIDAYLPVKGDDGWWPRLLNELQMLMFNSELNRLREERGKPVISGLWLWGGGDNRVTPNLSEIYSRCVVHDDTFSDPFLESILAKAGIEVERTFSLDSAESGRILCVSAELLPLAQYDDFFAWQEKLLALDEQLIKPLKQALANGSISELVIHSCNGSIFSLRPSSRWQFWKRVKPLANYA